MIKTITINYNDKDFFGQPVMRSEKYEIGGYENPEQLRKMLDKVMAAVKKGGYYAHFTHDDGSNDCVYVSGGEPSGHATLLHSNAWNSSDSEKFVSLREFKRSMAKELPMV